MNTYPSSISNLITVIGRGHGGTRAISHTLSASGVYMGDKLNNSGDLLPPDCLYNACRVISPYVCHLGGTRWDFSALHTMPIPDEFTRLVETYLASVLASDSPWRGWKLPETTLIFPWIVRMFPDIRYIYWVRDPRDAILSAHYTDDLSTFNIPYDHTDNVRERRAISWAYQTALCRATPKPKHWISVRFEDFILDQEATLTRLENYLDLGFPLARIPVRPDSVGRWKTDPEPSNFACFAEEAKAWNYV